jgi:hypothetical protein
MLPNHNYTQDEKKVMHLCWKASVTGNTEEMKKFNCEACIAHQTCKDEAEYASDA